jgi:hypothetical protein
VGEASDQLVEQLRDICVALPEVTERPSHGTPAWFVRGKSFVTLWHRGHHDHDFPHAYRAVAPATLVALLDS